MRVEKERVEKECEKRKRVLRIASRERESRIRER